MVDVPMIGVSCWCGLPFSMPKSLNAECLRNGTNFHCPLGHSITYADTETDKLRRERDRLKQKIAQRDDEIKNWADMATAEKRRASALKGQLTKTRKRVQAGVCPCCNRTFQNLARHMNSKHPDFEPSVDDIVVPLKKKEAG